jgi:hypothetical protein
MIPLPSLLRQDHVPVVQRLNDFHGRPIYGRPVPPVRPVRPVPPVAIISS